jgi:hypothetical protein
MFCLLTRFVAWDYCAAPGLAFTGGAHGQGDRSLWSPRRPLIIIMSVRYTLAKTPYILVGDPL